MNFQDHLQQLERLDRLISRRGTGSPQELAQKFNISERSAYRLIDDLRAFGFTIIYDAERRSYCYEGKGGFMLNLGPDKNLTGQRFILSLPNSGIDAPHLCIKLKETENTAMLAAAFFEA